MKTISYLVSKISMIVLFGPLVFIGANIMILAALIGLTVFFAVVKTIGYQLS